MFFDVYRYRFVVDPLDRPLLGKLILLGLSNNRRLSNSPIFIAAMFEQKNVVGEAVAPQPFIPIPRIGYY
jgi:hypothetical protein